MDAAAKGEGAHDAPYRALVEDAHQLGLLLVQTGRLIAVAESCTGGAVACALTETAGSSAWFDRGFVTYSNLSKEQLLGVRSDTLAVHGAVSEPTAFEMAAGALARSSAQVAVSITGIAGPGGGVPGKPVGTVCFGWAVADEAPTVETCHFQGTRSMIRLLAARHALRRAIELISGG